MPWDVDGDDILSTIKLHHLKHTVLIFIHLDGFSSRFVYFAAEKLIQGPHPKDISALK